jgi:hypothetical protein
MKPTKRYYWEQNVILKESSAHSSLVPCKKDIKSYCNDTQIYCGGYFKSIMSNMYTKYIIWIHNIDTVSFPLYPTYVTDLFLNLYISTLKMEAAYSYKNSVTTYKTTQCLSDLLPCNMAV